MQPFVTSRVALLTATFVLMVSTAVHAVTLRTPAVPANSGEQIDCIATNVGSKETTVSVQMFSLAGTVVTATINQCAEGALAPQASCQVTPPANTPVSCVFTAKGKLRAMAAVFDHSNGDRLAGTIPATK